MSDETTILNFRRFLEEHQLTAAFMNTINDGLEGVALKARPTSRLGSSQKQRNRKHSSIRSRVEHVFRVIKCQFGYTKVRYRGLAKNAA